MISARSARQARVIRAAQQWAEDNGRTEQADAIAKAAIESAVHLGRDLLPNEIDALARLTIERLEREAQVRKDKAERAAKLEQERLDYLARRQRDYRLTGG